VCISSHEWTRARSVRRFRTRSQHFVAGIAPPSMRATFLPDSEHFVARTDARAKNATKYCLAAGAPAPLPSRS
jgi:hypothetical protein